MTAYAIAHVEVTDPEGYRHYASQTEASAAAFGGRFLVKGGAQVQVEGETRPRTAVIAFPDMEAARAWYASPEYQRLKALALNYSVRDLIFVEGK